MERDDGRQHFQLMATRGNRLVQWLGRFTPTKSRPVLSCAGLDPQEEYFIFELADRITEHVKIDDTPESEAQLRELPEHWRYIEPLIYYFNQVNNGGHHQYFWNSQGVYRHLVTEGLAYFQADEFIENYQEALTFYDPNAYEVRNGATWEGFRAGDPGDRFDLQDSKFYAIKPGLDEILTQVVRWKLKDYR